MFYSVLINSSITQLVQFIYDKGIVIFLLPKF